MRIGQLLRDSGSEGVDIFMVNERLESALAWCKENEIESIRLERFNLKRFNREQKKKRLKRLKKKRRKSLTEKGKNRI